MMKIGRNDRFEEIDVLRGLAALCVVISHYTSHCVKFFGEAPFQIDTIYGFYAVDLFFVISGFVIYFTLDKCDTWKDFAFSRLTRLYPAYLTALNLMVWVGILVFREKMWWGGYITNLTMLQEFLGFGNLDNVFWSLTVELAFYVNMALLFSFGFLRRIERVAALWLAFACLWSLVDQHLGFKLPEFLPRLLILPHVPFFMAGIMFYLVGSKGLTPPRIGIMLAALATVGWMHGMERMGIAVVLFGIFGLALAGKLRFAISRVTLWLGTISYSLYVSHRNLGYSTMFRLHDNGVPVGIILVVTFIGAMTLATVLTYLIERPALRILRQWYRTRRSHSTVKE